MLYVHAVKDPVALDILTLCYIPHSVACSDLLVLNQVGIHVHYVRSRLLLTKYKISIVYLCLAVKRGTGGRIAHKEILVH